MKRLELALGIYDDPEGKTQEDYIVDLYGSNIAIFGSAMSGKTTLLKTILIRIHQMVSNPEKEEIYVLDFNSNIGKYGDLPCVRACFDATNDENVRRIFKIVESRLAENIQKLAGKNYVQADSEDAPNHVTFILDGLNSFYSESRYDSYKENLAKLVRDGISKGVSVIFTAYTPSGEINRLLSSFKSIIAFDMSAEHYSALYNGKVMKPIVLQGRGLANRDKKAYEFHAYYPYNRQQYPGGHGEDAALEAFVDGFTGYHTQDTFEHLMKEHLKSFNTNLDVNTWKNFTDEDIIEPGQAVVGLNYHSLERIVINLRSAGAIAIYGKKKWGKSNLLRLLLYGALGIPGVRFVCLEDGRKGLNPVKDIFEYWRELQSKEERNSSPNWSQYENIGEFIGFLEDEGYLTEGGIYHQDVDKESRPFTVFIIQSRQFYNSGKGARTDMLPEKLSALIDNAEVENVVFIFSDVQRILDYESRDYFNNGIKHAFLLDDIVRFINDTKGQNSVFAHQDPLELKSEFGKCMIGDGFYFNLEADTIEKYKMLHVAEERVGEEKTEALWPCVKKQGRLDAANENPEFESHEDDMEEVLSDIEEKDKDTGNLVECTKKKEINTNEKKEGADSEKVYSPEEFIDVLF